MADFQPAAEAVSLANADAAQMSSNERLKAQSQGLFFVSASGEVRSFLDEVNDLDSGAEVSIGNAAKELSKFFGIYKQQARGERGKKLDDHFFMVRIKAPGGGGFSQQGFAVRRQGQRVGNGPVHPLHLLPPEACLRLYHNTV